MSKKSEDFLSTWFVVLLINQIFIFHACFHPACIIAALPHTAVITYLFLYFFGEKKEDFSEKESDETPIQTKRKRIDVTDLTDKSDEFDQLLKELQKLALSSKKEVDPLKEKGDKFEKYIGKKFEDKGDLVIYNGFIRGYEDKGVDVISLSPQTRSVNLVQCKNWTKKSMFLSDIENIHTKLSQYDFDFSNLSSTEINRYLQLKKDTNSIKSILKITKQNLRYYTIRKTLYVSSDKVMDLRIGEKLMMIKPNIYRYKDMKIVVHGMKYN